MLVLIVEDDRDLAFLIIEQLEERGYEAACVHTARDAVAWLSARTPYLAILDYTLPDMNAEALLEVLKDKGQPLPPFIVATGQGDERIAATMMKLGARDYIVKDRFFLELLPGQINRVAREIENERQRKEAEQELADHALELEQLYHQLDAELEKARQLHERILPTAFPAVQNLNFAAHYQPAQALGGDFYDVLHTGDKLIFYLSDVSGHGLDGAMLSVFVKHTIKSYIYFTDAHSVTPAGILGHLAGQFSRENYPEDLYICIFLAVLDLGSMELAYCAAGFQEAMLVQLGSGDKLKCISKGMFITSNYPVEILDFQEDSIKLTPGTTIFCNTDGLTEQGGNGSCYGDRLADVFFQNAHLPAQLVGQAVAEDFRRFNNGSLQGRDDITFLVIKVEPK